MTRLGVRIAFLATTGCVALAGLAGGGEDPLPASEDAAVPPDAPAEASGEAGPEASVAFPARDCEPSTWDGGDRSCDGLPTNAACGQDRVCAPDGGCVDNVLTLRLVCPTALSLAQLCVGAGRGFGGAFAARGYYWWQCASVFDCPSPWRGLACDGFCDASDCQPAPYCSGAIFDGGGPLPRCFTDEHEKISPDEYQSCSGYNPVWLLRTRCRF